MMAGQWLKKGITKVISNPWIHRCFAIAAEIGLAIDVLYFYYGYASVSPEILDPEFTDKLNTPIMNTLNAWMLCAGSILSFDLVLDVNEQYLKRRALQRRGHDDVSVTAITSTKKAVIFENEKVKREHVSRFIFIATLVIPAVVSWATAVNGFRGVLAYFASRFRMISLFCVENFILTDTFRGTYDWQCFLMSGAYAIFGTVAMHFRLAGRMQLSNALRSFLLVAQVLPVLWNTLLNVFIWIRMLLVRRKREAGVNQWSCTVSEWRFIIYSVTAVTMTLLIVIVSGSAGFTLTATTGWDLATREVVVLVLATATALLPARISRSRAILAENTLTNAKRDVSDLLRSPMKIACAELDEVRYQPSLYGIQSSLSKYALPPLTTLTFHPYTCTCTCPVLS
jgi:hypothetical protein